MNDNQLVDWRCVQAVGKGPQQAIAQCIAVVCCSAGQQQVVATVKQLLSSLQVPRTSRGTRFMHTTLV